MLFVHLRVLETEEVLDEGKDRGDVAVDGGAHLEGLGYILRGQHAADGFHTARLIDGQYMGRVVGQSTA